MRPILLLGPMSCVLLLGPAGCDGPSDSEPADETQLRTAFVLDCWTEHRPGWPPPGGTYNTACLGATPLMRLLPPDYVGIPRAPYEELDAQIAEIEVQTDAGLQPISTVSVTEGALTLSTVGAVFEADALIDSRWWLDDAHTEYVTITDVATPTRFFNAGGSAYFPGYELEYRVVGEPGAQPICEVMEDGSHWAYLVGDVFVDVDHGTIESDPGSLLVACPTGALGKAITWGFSPWVHDFEPLQSPPGSPLLNLPLYQTGVRVVRADYCGDGEGHTVEGIEIQMKNTLAGQTFDDPKAQNEAIFGPDGAVCLDTPRNPEAVVGCVGPCSADLKSSGLESVHTLTKHVETSDD